MEMIFGDYRIYTHRPGGVKIRRLSDNKQLAVFSDKFKIKFYNDGEGLFDFILDEKDQKIYVKLEFNLKKKYFSYIYYRGDDNAKTPIFTLCIFYRPIQS